MILSTLFVLGAYLTRRAASTCPPFQFLLHNETSRKLPDPFTFLSRQKVLTKADWSCRGAEISALIHEYGLGNLPPKPAILNATLTGSTLTISAQQDGKSTSFAVQIHLPPTFLPYDNTTAYPAIITLDNNLPLNLTTHPIATITYNPSNLADPNTRSRGRFYDIHGSSHPSGAFLAWTWGLSLIIDALELLGPATTRIDTKHLGLTGCSRHGKAVLAMSALEPRITLTIPREAGVAGAAPWRLWPEYKCRPTCGIDPSMPWLDNPWMRKEFSAFGDSFARLPYDQHFLIGLIAPRGLLILENDVDFLHPGASVVGAKAGRMVYEALGSVRNMGFVMTGSHAHCQFPREATERKYLEMFLEEFLLKKEKKLDPTGVFVSVVEGEVERYVDWGVPVLE